MVKGARVRIKTSGPIRMPRLDQRDLRGRTCAACAAAWYAGKARGRSGVVIWLEQPDSRPDETPEALGRQPHHTIMPLRPPA